MTTPGDTIAATIDEIERSTRAVVLQVARERAERTAVHLRRTDAQRVDPSPAPYHGAIPAMRKATAPDPIDSYVGDRLRIRRVLMRMTQEALAAAVDLSFQQVQKYEKGTNRMGASRIAQFAAILGCPPAWFFEGAPTPNVHGCPPRSQEADEIAARVAADLASPDGLRLQRAFAQMRDPKMRRNFVDFVETVVGASAAAPPLALAS